MKIIAKSSLFPSLADIEFATKDPDTITQELVSFYEAASGRTLSRADPVRLFLDAIILAVVHQRHSIDKSAKANLLAYASGDNLEHLGALLGVRRLEASSASTTFKFTLSRTYPAAQVIPQGTRGVAGSVAFATTESLTIPAGELSGTVTAQCTQAGDIGNGYLPGQINRLGDVLPFQVALENLTQTSGGSDAEEDEPFRERIQMAPESFSVAGPIRAYEYFARTADPDIIDVAVVGPPTTSPGHVNIYPLMAGGVIPTDEVIESVYEACNAENTRPDTDFLHVYKPDIVKYEVKLKYYVDERDSASLRAIKGAVNVAVNDYVLWQKKELGRDINPSELIYRVVKAGAKRVEVSSPVFTVLRDWDIAQAENITIEYGGLERA